MSVPSNRIRHHGSTSPRKQCTPGASWGSGGLSRHLANSRPDFRSSSSFLPEPGNPVSGNPVQEIILARKDEPTSRQESSGKGDSWKLETFQMEPCGNQSRPVEPDQQPEASLAWWVTTPTKRRQ